MDTVILQPKLLTAKEVAKLLRMPLSTVYYLAKTRKIPSIQIGRIWRFREDEIIRLTHGEIRSDRREESADKQKVTNKKEVSDA